MLILVAASDWRNMPAYRTRHSAAPCALPQLTRTDMPDASCSLALPQINRERTAAWSIQSPQARFRPTAPEHPSSTQPSTIDMKMAQIRRGIPGQSLDHECAARDSNPEPAD